MPPPMATLRELLARDGPITLIGAHSAVSARLGARAGFDGIWASGFEISAARGVPDANFLTMTEALAAARELADAVSIPVVADCDNGFGNAINVIRTVREYESAGVAAICIEDNVFPKRCSFYGGVRRELVPKEEHAGKIRACKAAQRTAEFVVIARTEALIAGWGQNEALARAHLYADAGADMVLVHSKSKAFDELRELASHWGRAVPLVVVPTIFSHTSVDECHAAGFKMVIFANQGLRASVAAMAETFAAIRAAGRASVVEDRIATLPQIYDLSGVSELGLQESLFLPEGEPPARAVILAAGYEPALMPLIADRPKAMLDVKGSTILERQVSTLASCGVTHIACVRGYLKERVTVAGLTYFDNDEYADTGELWSLAKAATFLGHRTLVLYGDVVFDPELVRKLLAAEGDVVCLVDRSLADAAPDPAPGRRTDLVVLEGAGAPGHRFVPSGASLPVRRIGQQIAAAEAHGEFAAMLLMTRAGADLLLAVWEELAALPADVPFHEAPTARRAALPDALQELVARGHDVRAVETYKGWMEVDTFEDYQRAWANVPS